MHYNETKPLKGTTMTIKNFARTAAFAVGSLVLPTPRIKQEKETFDIDAHIAAVQASFLASVKDDLKPSV